MIITTVKVCKFSYNLEFDYGNNYRITRNYPKRRVTVVSFTSDNFRNALKRLEAFQQYICAD